MPNRPLPPDNMTNLWNDVLARLRVLERKNLPLPETAGALQTFENGSPLGDTLSLDFGANLQATLIGNRYVRVEAPASAPEFDAIVDGTIGTSSEDARTFLGIGEACAYLKDTLGLESVNILVRNNHDTTYSSSGLESYVETTNWNSPGAVHLFGLRGGQDASVQSQVQTGISWQLGGFRPLSGHFPGGLAMYWIHGFAEFELGSQSTKPFELLYMEDTHCDWSSRTGAAASRLIARDCTFDLISSQTLVTEMGYYDNCDMAFRSISGAGGTLTFGGSACYFQGELNCGSSSGTHQITLPTVFDFIIRTSPFNRSGISVQDDFIVNVPAGANGRFWPLNDGFSPGGFDFRSPSATDVLDLRGSFGPINIGGDCGQLIMDVACGNLTVANPGTADMVPLVRAQIQGNLSIGHAVVDIGFDGDGRAATINGPASGVLNFKSNTLSSGTLLTYTGDYSHLIVLYNEANASGTAQPYNFAAACNDNLLIMMGTGDWPVAGTDAGLRNLVFPEDFGGGVPIVTGHVIEDEGTPLTQRANLNFVGAGVTVTDSAPDTIVTIPGGGGSGDTLVAWVGL